VQRIIVPHQKMYSDPNRIKQILLNLLSNSLKYTEKGSIEIIIESYGSTVNTPRSVVNKKIGKK
jgi:signal transduction histidine kinase